MARPSSFREEYAGQAFQLCLLGATDKDLANFFGVSETTVNNWKDAHPEFLEALKEGKQQADAKVADSLFQRALGYEHPEVKVFLHNGEPVLVPLTKHYPPDTTAAIFWLKNRRPDMWRDKRELDVQDTTPPREYTPEQMWERIQRKLRIEGREALFRGEDAVN